MVTPDPISGLYFDSVPEITLRAFQHFSTLPWLREKGWYLAGGTALALQVGHRESLDLDFFTPEKLFEMNPLLSRLEKEKGWTTDVAYEGTVFGDFRGAEMSFISMPQFVPKLPFGAYGNIDIVSVPDIAVMKVIAISRRGTKRDYFDLYWHAKNVEPLEHVIFKLKEQYPAVAHNYNHILNSLVFFGDADHDPRPAPVMKMSWNEVKAFFVREVPKITRSVLELND